MAIHPRNEENAKALCKAFDEKGHHWFNGEGYIYFVEEPYSDIRFGDETCYDNDGTGGTRNFYKERGYTIIEFEDVDLS